MKRTPPRLVIDLSFLCTDVYEMSRRHKRLWLAAWGSACPLNSRLGCSGMTSSPNGWFVWGQYSSRPTTQRDAFRSTPIWPRMKTARIPGMGRRSNYRSIKDSLCFFSTVRGAIRAL